MDSRALIGVIDNLESTSVTDALSANMGRELNEKINDKDIITVSLNNVNASLSNTTGTLPFSYVYTSTGDKLSLSNNKIVIGSGVTKVKVSAHVWAKSSDRVWFKLKRNTTVIASMIGNDSCGYNTLDVATKYITAGEGETISIDYENNGTVTMNQGSANANETYLTVEVVE